MVSPSPSPHDDAARGQTMFLTFTASTLTVTGTVGLLAFIPTWWMLAIALGFHAVATVVVFVAIIAAATDRTDDHRAGI